MSKDSLLPKYNSLFSNFQQLLEENSEYRLCLEEILEALERFKQRMKPVRARGKARPQISKGEKQ